MKWVHLSLQKKKQVKERKVVVCPNSRVVVATGPSTQGDRVYSQEGGFFTSQTRLTKLRRLPEVKRHGWRFLTHFPSLEFTQLLARTLKTETCLAPCRDTSRITVHHTWLRFNGNPHNTIYSLCMGSVLCCLAPRVLGRTCLSFSACQNPELLHCSGRFYPYRRLCRTLKRQPSPTTRGHSRRKGGPLGEICTDTGHTSRHH